MAMTFGIHMQYSDRWEGCDVFIDQQYVGRLVMDTATGIWEIELKFPDGRIIHRMMPYPSDEREAKAYFGTMYSQGKLV